MAPAEIAKEDSLIADSANPPTLLSRTRATIVEIRILVVPELRMA
jgi:hypothetical protein